MRKASVLFAQLRMSLFALAYLPTLAAQAAMCKDPHGTIIVNEERSCAPGNMCRDNDRNWSFEECARIEAAQVAREKDRADDAAREARRIAELRTARDQANARAKEPWIGMRDSEADAIKYYWGLPTHKNVTTDVGGRHEQWVYSSHRFLYFDNGVLTAIQE